MPRLRRRRHRGYISQELFEKLFEQGLQLITRLLIGGAAALAPRDRTQIAIANQS